MKRREFFLFSALAAHPEIPAEYRLYFRLFVNVILLQFLCLGVSSASASPPADWPNNILSPPDAGTPPDRAFTKTMTLAAETVSVKSTGWKFSESRGVRFDKDVVRLEATTARPTAQASCTLTFDPPTRIPFLLSARCESDTTRLDDVCGLFVDVIYDDDTPLWGQIVAFPRGQYGRRASDMSFAPQKPVKELRVYLLLRKAEGTAHFDRVYVGPVPLTPFRFQVLGGLFGRGSAAAFLRPGRLDDRIGTEVLLRTTPESAPIPLKRRDQTPLFLLENDADAVAATVACRLKRDGDHADRTVEVDLSPCDNGRGYCVWTASSMERIFPYSLPRVRSDDASGFPSAETLAEETGALRERLKAPTATLEAARNEYESFQIAMLSPKDLDKVRVELTELVSTKDPATKIPAGHLDWKQVGFVRMDRLQRHPADAEGVPGWRPDPLLPVERFDVPAGRTQPVWVTVYVPKGTPPGSYRGTATVRPENAPATEIPLELTVWDFELPDEGHFKNAFALMDGFLEKVYGLRPTTPELRKRYGDFLIRHRLSPEADISRTAPPVLDELEYYRDRGLGSFNILNMVEPRGKRPWMCNSDVSVYTPEFKAKMLAVLKPYVEELRKRRLVDRAYIYTFDERNETYTGVITEFFGMIKEHFPEIPTFSTSYFTPEPELMDKMNVDWFCPKTSLYDRESADRCRAAGKQVWAYVCCHPDQPYANFMCRFPLIESRLLFWQSYAERFDGLLYWAVNYWSHKTHVPIDPAAGPLIDWSLELSIAGGIYGDGLLMYAGTDGRPIGSIRLANIRDGLEDYEYFYRLSEKTGSTEAAEKHCRTISPTLSVFARSPALLSSLRRQVAAELAAPVRKRVTQEPRTQAVLRRSSGVEP